MFNLTAIGNLTRDAEIKQVGENNVISFSIAINRKLSSGEEVTYLNCSYWVKSTAIHQYLVKGTKVAIQAGWYTNKESNGKYYQQFQVNRLELLGNSGNQAKDEPVQKGEQGDDDLPF